MIESNALIAPPPDAGFEERLVRNLQPIRGFAVAAALYHAFDIGIADAVLNECGQQLERLATRFGLDETRLRGFMNFLQAEGFIVLDGDAVHPLDRLAEMREAWPWYEMLIGGYARTYLDIGEGLKSQSGPLSRDGARVGAGSCKISHYDAIPLTRKLLGQMPQAPRKIVDLGCGNALYLEELCAQFPELTAIGVEPDAGGHHESTVKIGSTPFNHHIRLINATAQKYIETTRETGVDAVIIAFVLQEILGQDGRHGAIDFLRNVALKFPDAHIAVIEVDDRAGDGAAMSHPLAQAYYNPYFLVHHFTSQMLKGPGFWLELFEEAGLHLVARGTTETNVDSTGFELGFLLECTPARNGEWHLAAEADA
jgi:2-ketoarginine methyltransferase